MAVSVVVVVGARLIVRDGGDPRLGVMIALILLTLAQVAVVILFASRQGRPTASDFGLVRPPLARATGMMVTVLVAASVLSAAWTVALGLDEDALDITDRPAVESGTLHALLFLVLLAVATPLGEEFLFRGYFLRALSNWRGAWPAIVTTSVVFAAVHVGQTPIGFLVPVLLLGLGFGFLYHWTGSLYPALAMHALVNALSAGTVFEGWQLPAAMVFSVALTLAIARLIAVLAGWRVHVREMSCPGWSGGEACKPMLEVLALVADGKPNDDNRPGALHQRDHGQDHLAHIFTELGVDDRTVAVTVALDRGIILKR